MAIEEFIENEFHRVRNEINTHFSQFYIEQIKGLQMPECSCGGKFQML